jgi:hypothetical protein
MKKTIAKLMAAAMMLSAVPAVTLPSFVSKAADTVAATNTSTATYQAQFLGGEGIVKPSADGEIFSFYLPATKTAKVTNGNVAFADTARVSSDDFDFAVVNAALPAEVAANIQLSKSVVNNLVHVKATLNVTKMTSAQKTQFVNAVKDNTNTFKVKAIRKYNNRDLDGDGKTNSVIAIESGKSYTITKPDGSKETLTYDQMNNSYVFGDNIEVVSERTYAIGGTYDNGKIKTGVADEDGYLMDGNVYAKISKTLSDGIAEVELLKQDNNEANKLKDNDQLRGKLLKLNEVRIGGVNYKVGKLGSQCLKKAKMKKVQLKNCSKVGKGALRECKQLKNVNLKDKNKVRKIHTKAFYKCKNLKSVAIDARKLNTVGTDSFVGVKKNCKIKLKASKSKFNQVIKKFKKANKKNTTLKYTRLEP